MIAPDLLTIAAYVVGFVLILILAVIENRALVSGSETISSFLHRHLFAGIASAAWIAFGLGVAFGHFISGPIVCAP